MSNIKMQMNFSNNQNTGQLINNQRQYRHNNNTLQLKLGYNSNNRNCAVLKITGNKHCKSCGGK
tara:strand:+ start:799 stop:990 length:192 start_codon:yes stop_codon:yes gene_type:complete